jgi:hypothetical protein
MFMPRGGHRENAGRKSGWNHVETQVIRVPKNITEQLLDIARKLDRGESLDSVSKSEIKNIDSDTQSKNDLVTESVKHVLIKWKERANAASPKNSDWRKARQILGELEPIVYEGKILESVTESKVVPGQMSLLENESVTETIELNNETVTNSNNSAFESVTVSINEINESVTESEVWMTSKECWKYLGEPGSYETFRKLSPGKLEQLHGVRADPQRKEKGKYGSRWIRVVNSATPPDQVNPLPEGSERSEEG